MDDLEDPNKVLMDGIDQSLVEKVCTASMDRDYCRSVLLSDPEGLTNVLYRLGLVATSASLKIIPGVNGEIGNVLIGIKDSDTRNRVQGCQTDIDGINEDMRQANTYAGTQSYNEEAQSLVSAENKIASCNTRFVALPTIQSPIKSSTSKIEKLINICAVIVKMLKSS
nr:hypothetical protein CFP56_64395 [Quercus suber]